MLSFPVQTCQVTNKFTLGVFFFPPGDNSYAVFLTREKVTVGHDSVKLLPPLLEKRRLDSMLCRLRSVCAVVPSVCLLLHQGLDERLYHENNCAYY